MIPDAAVQAAARALADLGEADNGENQFADFARAALEAAAPFIAAEAWDEGFSDGMDEMATSDNPYRGKS